MAQPVQQRCTMKRHDDSDGRHDNGKGQQGNTRHNDAGGDNDDAGGIGTSVILLSLVPGNTWQDQHRRAVPQPLALMKALMTKTMRGVSGVRVGQNWEWGMTEIVTL